MHFLVGIGPLAFLNEAVRVNYLTFAHMNEDANQSKLHHISPYPVKELATD